MCGGTAAAAARPTPVNGLSPRVRGNRAGDAIDPGCAGSIPACAGEPEQRNERHISYRVYPRVCGGTFHVQLRFNVKKGLSPRVRGNRLDKLRNDKRLRSIPACAGEPDRLDTNRGLDKVYPRVCGGTAGGMMMDDGYPGLSPRVRGNRPHLHRTLSGAGSIPACAGEPMAEPGPKARPWVYPRVCGGTAKMNLSPAARLGLSPRVRGNHRCTGANGAG